MSEASRPFIIWTLQRTGGTNLTARLVTLSGLKGAPHEPFNIGRVYGDLTQKWNDTGDQLALDSSMQEIVSRNEVIKHCVEMVPWAVTDALLRASVNAGYRHLFLYRQEPLDRLLSLHFAKVSGVWGPDMKDRLGSEGSNPDGLSPIAVDGLIDHERNCVKLLNQIRQRLVDLGAPYFSTAYEQIYRASSVSDVEMHLGALLSHLDFKVAGDSFKAWVGEVLGKGDQGTRSYYTKMPGYESLRQQCDTLQRFTPDALSPTIRRLTAAHPWVLKSSVDTFPAVIRAGEDLELGGVCVLSPDAPAKVSLSVRSDKGIEPVKWGIRSPKMATDYPAAPNSASARWIFGTESVRPGAAFALILKAEDQHELRLFEISVR